MASSPRSGRCHALGTAESGGLSTARLDAYSENCSQLTPGLALGSPSEPKRVRRVIPPRHTARVGCMQVDATTQAVLDALAEPGAAPCSTAAVAQRAGVDRDAMPGVLAELVAAGWVFGDPEGWELTGAGYSHATRRPGSGLLGGSRDSAVAGWPAGRPAFRSQLSWTARMPTS